MVWDTGATKLHRTINHELIVNKGDRSQNLNRTDYPKGEISRHLNVGTLVLVPHRTSRDWIGSESRPANHSPAKPRLVNPEITCPTSPPPQLWTARFKRSIRILPFPSHSGGVVLFVPGSRKPFHAERSLNWRARRATILSGIELLGWAFTFSLLGCADFHIFIPNLKSSGK